MRCLAPPEAHFDLDFVPLLQESAGGPDPYLQIVVVRARPNAYFLDL
jgi:hypothetical protein